MRVTVSAALLAVLVLGGAHAQEQSGDVKAWVDSDWAAKAEFMRIHGVQPVRDCEADEKRVQDCWTTSTYELSGWSLSMVASETQPGTSVFCIEKTGGRLRWCKDNDSGQSQKFIRQGDDWVEFGR